MQKSIIIAAMLSCAACQQNTTPPQTAKPLHVAYEQAISPRGEEVCFGGFGSSMAYDSEDGTFYLLTDRGPNVDGPTPESKIFPFPDYSPTIGHFRCEGDSLILIKKIVLKDSDGKPLLGLPNREGDGVTGEVAYNSDGEIITSNFKGIDSEGLTLAPDGSFYVSDEYAPFIMHFSAEGELLEERAPSRGIPAHFAKRRPNRGMEGITISKDGKRLFGIMQSPLYLPDQRTKNNSLNNRILEINLEDGSTREYIYRLEATKLIVSEITFVNDSTLLVLERDGKFPTNGKGNKRIYEINIAEASDVSDLEVERMDSKALEENGIKPVKKKLFVDILKAIPDYTHDKVEGMALINDHTIAIVNDDDFSTIETKDGRLEPKRKANGEVDHSTVYLIEL